VAVVEVVHHQAVQLDQVMPVLVVVFQIMVRLAQQTLVVVVEVPMLE
jgi:hypothetical protein